MSHRKTCPLRGARWNARLPPLRAFLNSNESYTRIGPLGSSPTTLIFFSFLKRNLRYLRLFFVLSL